MRIFGWNTDRLFSAIEKTFRFDRMWLEKHGPDTADPDNATIWRQARDSAVVGEKARELFGPDVIWPPCSGAARRCGPNRARSSATGAYILLTRRVSKKSAGSDNHE